MVGDGNNVRITRIGFTTLKSCDSTFKLNNILCAPTSRKIFSLFLNFALIITPSLIFSLISSL